LYIAGIMYASIVATALILHYLFYFTGLTPESSRKIETVTQFAIDYSFYLNLAAIVVTGCMLYLSKQHKLRMASKSKHQHHDHGGSGLDLQGIVTWIFIAVLAGGLLSWVWLQV